MARGNRKRPLTSTMPERRTEQMRPDQPIDFHMNDDVDDFVSARHDRLQKSGESDSESVSSADEPEAIEHEVLPFDASDSDEDDDHADASSDDAGDDDRKDWGSRRHVWYGGDTHEYEIMGDGERETALRDEEEEAVRMQTEALSSLRAEDFHDDVDRESSSDDDDNAAASDGDTVMGKPGVVGRTPASTDALAAAAPEVPLLAAEAAAYERKLEDLRQSAQQYESKAVLFHLYSAFICNVAFYFALRTDPEVRGVDFRKHPVMARIVRIRALLEKAVDVPLGPDVSKAHNVIDVDADTDDDAEVADDDVAFVRAEDSAEVGMQRKDKTEKKKKKKKKRLSGTADANGTDCVAVVADDDDDDDVNALLRGQDDGAVDVDIESRKRRKLNQLVGAMEGERKNKENRRMLSADVDHQPEKARVRSYTPLTNGRAEEEEAANLGRDGENDDENNDDDDDDVTDRMLAKKEKRDARKARRAAEQTKPHVYRFNDRVKEDGRRKASSQIVKNRGLTRYRPRDKKTPRTKNRLAYQKALKKRKSVARDYVGNIAPNYSGESTGINMSARKGSKLSTV